MNSETITSEIFHKIFTNADVANEKSDEPYASIKKLLRYFRSDIPGIPRYLYDADAVFFYNYDATIKEKNEDKRKDFAKCGDIMTSLWSPLTYYLGLNNGRVIGKNDDNINQILSSDKVENAFALFNYLAKYYASRGNLLLLPNSRNSKGQRKLNPDKFSNSEDKMDQFLFKVLKGTLIEYFGNNIENVKLWIISEHLECFFSDAFFQKSLKLTDIECGNVKLELDIDKIKIDNLQSLIDDTTMIENYAYSGFKEKDWTSYMERLNKVIAYRNSQAFATHLPFEW